MIVEQNPETSNYHKVRRVLRWATRACPEIDVMAMLDVFNAQGTATFDDVVDMCIEYMGDATGKWYVYDENYNIREATGE